MKQKSTVLVLYMFFVFAGANAQYVTIPDTVFRNDLINKYPGCFNAAKQMDTACVVLPTVSPSLAFINLPMKNMDGIQYFKNLTTLIIGTTQLTTLPLLPAGLKELNCSYNSQLTSLPALPAGLTSLTVNNNNLINLPPVPSSLLYLICSNNPIVNLPALPNGLLSLSCSYTSITSLPVLPNSLTQLFCNNNSINNLPAMPTSLNYLNCSYIPLVTTLPALPYGLNTLICDGDQLSTLPGLPATLKNVSCSSNIITTLPSLPDSITDINCDANLLVSLPPLPAQLQRFSCANNSITALLSLPAGLITLRCNQNQLTGLPLLPNSITTIACGNNLLTSLPTLPSSLQDFDCNTNSITSLPYLPGSLIMLNVSTNTISILPTLPPNITNLTCDQNPLTVLPALPDSLISLSCNYTPIITTPPFPSRLQRVSFSWCPRLKHLSGFNDNLGLLTLIVDDSLYCLPLLPPHLTNLSLSQTPVYCLPNIPAGCNISPLLPICNAANNSHQCQSYPQIYGLIYNDNDSNNIKDPGEPGRENIRVQLSNGAYAFTNKNGVFNITADTIGSYDVTILSPNFYDARPLTYVHNFSSYTDSVQDTFALKPNIIKDSIAIHITPMQNRARPGIAFVYNIVYENEGTTDLAPRIVMKYDQTLLIYDSCSLPGFVQSGDSLVLNANTLTPGQFVSFMSYYTVKTTATQGSNLLTKVNAMASSAYFYDSATTIVRTSYDPNDKEATPEMTPTQVATGNYIDYLIHFQNTGNDTASTVVIADTLNTLLQNNVLQMIGTSHLCKTTLNNGIVTFEFLNINLPDSNVSKTKSNGYIRFLIKPKSSVVLGDSIPNKASIYFDYNTPVETNTCQTFIKANLLPVTFMNYQVSLKAMNQVVNEWTTASEINTSHFNVQRSMNGKDFSTIGRVNAKGRSNGTMFYSFTDEKPGFIAGEKLYYRLEIIDNDGRKAYSATQMIVLRSSGISIYPNPAHGIVTVEGNDMKTISISDNTGRLMMSGKAGNSNIQTLQTGQLGKGIYMLKVTTNNGEQKTGKLVVQ